MRGRTATVEALRALGMPLTLATEVVEVSNPHQQGLDIGSLLRHPPIGPTRSHITPHDSALLYLGAGHAGITRQIWFVFDASNIAWGAEFQKLRFRVYVDSGDISDLTAPSNDFLLVDLPLAGLVGGWYGTASSIGTSGVASDYLDCQWNGLSNPNSFGMSFRFPMPFSNGILVQLGKLDTGVWTPLSNSTESMFAWASYEEGSLLWPEIRLKTKSDEDAHTDGSPIVYLEEDSGKGCAAALLFCYDSDNELAYEENWTFVTNLSEAGSTNLVTNGELTTSAGWAFGTGWTHDIINGEADHASAGTSSLTFPAAQPAIGQTYRLKYSVKNRTVGGVTASCGGVSNVIKSADGTYSHYFMAITTDPVAFACSTTARLSIDDVSLVEMPMCQTSGTEDMFGIKQTYYFSGDVQNSNLATVMSLDHDTVTVEAFRSFLRDSINWTSGGYGFIRTSTVTPVASNHTTLIYYQEI